MLTDQKTQICDAINSLQLDLKSQCNPHPNASKLFCGYQQILKFIRKGKRHRIANIILKRNRSGRLTLVDNKT
jgi:hypothetical protein